MIAVIAAACDSPASKPTAEPDPPTPIPTVATEAEHVGEDSTANANTSGQGIADPEVRACLTEEMGEDAFDNLGQGSGIGLGEEWVAAFEKCGVASGEDGTVLGGRGGGGRLGGGFVGSGIADPEVRECLLEEMGEDALDNLGQGSGIGLGEEWVAAFEKCGVSSGAGRGTLADPENRECLLEELGEDALDNLGQGSGIGLGEEWVAALEKCGINFGDAATPFGGGGGGSRGGFAVGGAFGDPEVQECLSTELGEDFGSQGRGIFGGQAGGGLSEELTAAFEECGIDLAGGFAGRLGGGGGGFAGRLGGGGFGGDGSFQECLTEALGEDALLQLRNPDGPPSAELQAALQGCGNVVGIPIEPGSGGSDGDDLVTEEPIATPIPVSDLTVEQLTCLLSELEPADLASAVVSTSSGDLSKVTDTVLAALQTCGVGS